MIAALLAAATVAAAPADPYAPLRLYEGHWRAVTSKGKTIDIANTCARVGEFFVCSQSVDGKGAALIVFRPTGKANGALTYETQPVVGGQTGLGKWFTLTISGADWTYDDSGAENGRKVWRRTLNHVTGANHIHFEIQESGDGRRWTTMLSGDEQRLP